MTPPTPEELLRLARKTWPGSRPHLLDVHEVLICDSTSGAIRVGVDDETPTHRAAIHAALLVLAGELKLEMDGYRLRVSLCGADGRWETMSVPGPYVSPFNRPKEDP